MTEPARLPHGRKLVGRARELAELEAAIDDAERGRGRLVLLAGEPGIGKTSLCDAATALAEARGFSVHWGRCWEAGGAPAYFPWLGALSALARALDDVTLAAALADGALVLTEVLPELQSRLPPISVGAQPPAEEARFRVFRAVVALVREASRREQRGITLVLDDLHAADRSSLLLLQFLARELRGAKLLVIATYRDVEARMETETSELIARIGREGTCLSLSRLERQDATALVTAHTGSGAEDVGDRIVERAQGNPLFLEEMLRLLAEQGPESIAAGVVPHGVRDVIGQRLARVGAHTRALLELAAVAGDEVEPSFLVAAGGEGAGLVENALDEATRAGVLVGRGERQRFGHALFREVLYRELSPARRQELHARVGAALEASAAPGSESPHAKLAHHALEGPPELLERGVGHALRAARRAQDLLAYDVAVETLERTLAGVALQAGPPRLRARVLVALGEACIRRGDGGTGKRHCREAGGIARALGDAELAAEATLVYGQVFVFGSVDPVLVGMLETSLEALPAGDSALRARLLGRLSAALQPAEDIEEPVCVARDAIATARRLGSKQTLLEVLHDSISAMMDCTDPAEAMALNLEAEALANELGDRARLLRTQGRLFFLHLGYGELEKADARVEAYEALAEELAAPWLGCRSRYFRAARATMHGRFAEAERLLEEASLLGEKMGDPLSSQLCASGRETLLRASERYAELFGPAAMSRQVQSERRFAQFWRTLHAGIAHARREEVEQAAACSEMIRGGFPRGIFSYFFMTEMAAISATKAQAESLLAWVSACREEYLSLGFSYISWEGPKSRLVALLLARLGRYDEASAAFEDALARLRALDTQPYLARTEYEHGRMFAERGAAGDETRAAKLFRSARERAVSLGMEGLVGHIDRRLAVLDQAAPNEAVGTPAPPPPGPTGSASPLTLALEGEYFRLGYRAETLRLKDSLGLRYIARLVEAPGREFHVLELVRERQGTSDASELADRGDSGELLDEAARESYRRRLADLEDTLAEAESFGDPVRASRAREEMEFLARELSRAVGLGGRARTAGVAAERARSAVQRRIRHVIERIEPHSPAVAKFLERSLKTGTYCSFVPVPD